MLIILSMASNPHTRPLLFINIHDSDDHTHHQTLATLLKHLHAVTTAYNKTIVG